MLEETPAQKLERLFGSFRAESLRDNIYSLFDEPDYFYYLAAPKSCVLMGGRGSGKTTALKCMSYEGQAALGKTDFAAPAYVGLYARINTNTVASFSGAEQTADGWQRLFGHFVNLMLSEEVLNYIQWLKHHRNNTTIDDEVDYNRIGKSLGLFGCNTLNALLKAVDDARMDLELFINNFGDDKPIISPLQRPIDVLMQELKKISGHESTDFFIILDEYENLIDYQQKVFNTLIKHSGGNYYFKIGVRELGWRERTTLNSAEVLIAPADYERIRIEEVLEGDFATFAKRVCEARLREADLADLGNPIIVEKLLPGMTIKEEAMALGVERQIEEFRAHLLASPETSRLATLHPHEIFVFYELEHRDRASTIKSLEDYFANKKSSSDRYENYAYSLLFAISGKGSTITKYYCGHSVLAKITFQNIRFYMQLVNECIREQISASKNLDQPVDPAHQTLAARRVGLSYLRELEGVSTVGGSLAKLLLGLGRVFQIMAANPIGGKPECNQFEIPENHAGATAPTEDEAKTLLTQAVMHLALIRTPGTKLTTENDIRSWDYAPHPIFAPYFGFSHRRKRKMPVTGIELLSLTRKPQETVKKLLGRRASLADEKLPEQMSMFDEYFR